MTQSVHRAQARPDGEPYVGLAPAALTLRGVEKAYPLGGERSLAVLQGIDLDVASGEIVVIVGGSGCGKSTLLRIIAGLEPRDRGSIAVGDRAVSGPGKDCGMVFQEHRLFPWLTVEQNVAFGVPDLLPDERRRTVAEHIALVGLTGFEKAYPQQLSGGMSQRAALARALAPRPRVLLLDEPFGALDALTKLRMQAELLRIWRAEQSTFLLVTHDVEEAIYLGSRIVVLSGRPGRVQHVIDVTLERPRERTSPEFSALRRSVLSELLAEERDAAFAAPASGAFES
jgi:ABC-type nitrate/sulfonate/bicarbonate transport system ATPase subunit